MSEIVMTLMNVRNMPDFETRLRCYEQAFCVSNDVLLSNRNMVNTEWVVQFVKDVFEHIANVEAEPWCFKQFYRLFVELNFEINTKTKTGAQIHDKIATWLLRDGVQIVKKCFEQAVPDTSVRAMSAWGVAIKLLGQVLHTTDKTNICSSVFPMALRSTIIPLVKETYRSWKMLVKAFAVDPMWHTLELTQDKASKVTSRLDMILKALRYKNVPETATEIFDCWWYCCISLQRRLVLHFEQVAHGLLRFCVGGSTEYKSVNEEFDIILHSVNCPLGPKLVSLMNDKLDRDKYSRFVYQEVPKLWHNLPYLLTTLLISKNNGVGGSPFDHPEIIKCHSLYIFQCIRFCDSKLNPIVLKEQVPDLIFELLSKIFSCTLLLPVERSAQLVLFLIQFVAWMGETKLCNEILSVCMIRLDAPKVFELITAGDPDGIYGKYVDELKVKLYEKEKTMKATSEIDNEAEKLCKIDEHEEVESTRSTQQPTLQLPAIGSSSVDSINEAGLSIVVNDDDDESDKECGPKTEDIKQQVLLDEKDEQDVSTEQQDHTIPVLSESNDAEKQDLMEIVSDKKNESIQDVIGTTPVIQEIVDEPTIPFKRIFSTTTSEITDKPSSIEGIHSEQNEANEKPGSMEAQCEQHESNFMAEITPSNTNNEVEEKTSIETTVHQNMDVEISENMPSKELSVERDDTSLITEETPMTPNNRETHQQYVSGMTTCTGTITTPSSILKKIGSPAPRKRVQFDVQQSDDTQKQTPRQSPLPQRTPIKFTNSPHPKQKRQLYASDLRSDTSNKTENLLPDDGASPSKRAMTAFGQSWPIRAPRESPRTGPVLVTPHRLIRRSKTIPPQPQQQSRPKSPELTSDLTMSALTSTPSTITTEISPNKNQNLSFGTQQKASPSKSPFKVEHDESSPVKTDHKRLNTNGDTSSEAVGIVIDRVLGQVEQKIHAVLDECKQQLTTQFDALLTDARRQITSELVELLRLCG